MSTLGTLIRLDRRSFDDIRASGGSEGFHKLVSRPEPFDIDRDWDIVRFLFDADGAPVNPISGGTDFPNSDEQWSRGGPARGFDPAEVEAIHQYLRSTSFDTLVPYLAAAAEAEPKLYPLNRDWLSPLAASSLRTLFGELLEFYAQASANADYVVFLTE